MQGKEADKINVHHLPTTTRGSRNRGSKDVDAEQAGSSPKDCQVSSLQALPRGNNPPAMPLLNFVKLFANNNVFYSCGLDVEDGHTSATCPQEW